MEGVPVDPVVVTEPVVLRSDHGSDRDRRDIGQSDVDAFVALAFDRAAEHQRRDRPRERVKRDKPGEDDDQRQPREADPSHENDELGASPSHAKAMA